MIRPLIIAAALLAAAPRLPRAEDMAGMDHGTMHHAGPASGALDAAMQTMMRDMAVKPTGDADRDFVLMMMPHHQGAIDMAKVELQYGKDPMLRRLAESIVAAQEKEIGDMKAWLAARP